MTQNNNVMINCIYYVITFWAKHLENWDPRWMACMQYSGWDKRTVELRCIGKTVAEYTATIY